MMQGLRGKKIPNGASLKPNIQIHIKVTMMLDIVKHVKSLPNNFSVSNSEMTSQNIIMSGMHNL